MSRIDINNDWEFGEQFDEQMLEKKYNSPDVNSVRLPHTNKEVPLHYFDEHEYQLVSGYRKVIKASEEWKSKRVILNFDGVAHLAEVFFNGEKIAEHRCGYTGFSVELTDRINYEEDNILVVKVDARENLNVPPFGFVIDYMTFGGIYREVYLEIKEKTYIGDVFTRTGEVTASGSGDTGTAVVKSSVKIDKAAGDTSKYRLIQQLIDGEKIINEVSADADTDIVEIEHKLTDIRLWSPESPHRYQVSTKLMLDDKAVDTYSFMTAIRSAEFKADGFYLNGKKYKIRGLNRHQSYAYVGYAMPESMQRLDATILKKELGCNAVRTSHYPQSHHFIDECDRAGLLVFMEFPGWQHIGDDEWKEQACENLREMITQYRNHPSIIIWGVRINESKDDDEFYKRTNQIAHALDDSRATGGVRAHKNSHLFEDVYTYNDFVHDGSNAGCEPKKKVTSDMTKGYLVTEYNGHMYPTKSFDWEEHRLQHLLRHARVLEDIAANEDIAGSFGWCMFDYNTHKDFGSGDRICYHGVMDMFRNPKLAATIYAMQQDEETVLELSSSMDIGEHPGCNRGKTYILSNADSVRMYKNDIFIKEYSGKDSEYKHLAHGPIVIDDFIGDEINRNESFTTKQARLVKEGLNHVALNGYRLPPKIIAKALWCMLAYRMNFGDAYTLYNKYIGDWGGTSTVYRFEAVKDGKVVKTITKCPMSKRNLVTDVSSNELIEGATYDVALIRVMMKDENGNLLPFYNDPIRISTEGPVEIIGPDTVPLMGGMSGVYVKSTGEAGEAKVTIKSTGGEMSEICLSIRKAE